VKAEGKPAFTVVSYSAYFSTVKLELICSSETSVDFSGLHGVIPQKTVLFITTAVRTSNPTSRLLFDRPLVVAGNTNHLGP
jgi:hypothetical protein